MTDAISHEPWMKVDFQDRSNIWTVAQMPGTSYYSVFQLNEVQQLIGIKASSEPRCTSSGCKPL